MKLEEIEIVLGTEEYLVQAQPYIQSSVWRKQLLTTVKPLMVQIGEASELEFSNVEDLLKLEPLLETILIHGIDSMLESLLDYSQVLRDAEETIKTTASDKQIAQAFYAVLGLADFLGLISTIRK